MFTKFVLLFYLGLFVEIRSEYETMFMSDISEIHLDRRLNTSGNHPVPQLSCSSDQKLCDHYEVQRISAMNIDTPTGVSWVYTILDITVPPFLEFINFLIDCENVGDAKIIKHSCHLSYEIKLKTMRVSEIKLLKLSKDQQTQGRQPVSQLRCVGGKVCDSVEVSDLLCHKKDEQHQWNCCTSKLPSFVNFDKLNVTCENVNELSTDEVVHDSCGVVYSFKLKTSRLSLIDALILHKNQETAGFEPRKQLRCFDDNIHCDKYVLSTVICKKEVWKWSCDALGEANVKLIDISVKCENVPDSNDTDVIIAGSCGVSYVLSEAERGWVGLYITIAVIAGTIVLVALVIILLWKCVFKSSSSQKSNNNNPVVSPLYTTMTYRNNIYDTPIIFSTIGTTSSKNRSLEIISEADVDTSFG